MKESELIKSTIQLAWLPDAYFSRSDFLKFEHRFSEPGGFSQQPENFFGFDIFEFGAIR